MKKGLRSVISSVNLLTTLALIGVLFIMVNYLGSRRYARWDFTKQKITALSGQTRQTLKSLKDPLTVVVFYQPTHRLYDRVKDLLEEYTRVSPKLQVEYVDPDQDVARARQLVGEFQLDVSDPNALNLIIFQAGTRHKYLSDTDLAEYDYTAMQFGGQPKVKSFKGEDAFTSAIINITQARSPLIWVTKGHGEKSIDSQEPAGLSALKQALGQQNMTVETVALLERATTAIPPEVKLILIPGPTHRFTEDEVALLHTYLNRGGRVLALLDPVTDTGLEDLLKRWGILVDQDIVVDPRARIPFVSAANLLIATYTEHPIVSKMKTLITMFPLARSVRPADPMPEHVKVTRLAMTSPDGWGETQTSVETFKFDEGTDLKGPVSIAVAAERTAVASTEQVGSTKPTRIVAIGDSDFVINTQLGNAGNKDLFLGAIYWLTEQEQLIGIGPKPLESIKLNLTASQLTHIFWFSLLGMPFVCGMLGTGMWFVRRN